MADSHTLTRLHIYTLCLTFSVFLLAFASFVASVVAVVFGCFVQLVTVWVTISFLLLCSLSVLFWLAVAAVAAVAAQI